MDSSGFINVIQKMIDRIDQLQNRLIDCESTINILNKNLGRDISLPQNKSELVQIINQAQAEREKSVFDRIKLLPEIQDLVKAGIVICGPPGKEGPQGRIGPSGPPGQRGLPGVEGHMGRDGYPGQDGRDGLNGMDGKNGIDGLFGRKGLPGDQGPRGKKGPTGAVDWADIEPQVKKLVNDYLKELLNV